MIIDMFGKPCPMPLVAAKKELDGGARALQVRVDNDTAVKNLTRLAEKSGLSLEVRVIDGGFLVSFSESDSALPTQEAASSEVLAPRAAQQVQGSDFAVFIGADHVGEGSAELGESLMKMALYTLSQADELPTSLLFMNGGVKLVAQEGQAADHVREMADRGVEVLVCGTCLNFFELQDSLQVGEVSNMYDILGRMQAASRVLSL